MNENGIPFKHYGENGTVVMVKAFASDINYLNAEVRKGIVEGFLMGCESLVWQYLNGQIFKGNPEGLQAVLDSNFNSEYYKEFKDLLLEYDKSLFDELQEGFYGIRIKVV